MKVLVVGTVPPPGGDAALRLAAEAARRVAAGDEVEVLSSNALSAAHRRARLDGLFLAAQLLLSSRRHDAVVLRIEAGVPLSERAGRVERALQLGALGFALSRYSEVTLRLDSPIPFPGGLGGRATRALWGSVHQIVISDEADRRLLLEVPEIVPDRIVVEAPAAVPERVEPRWPQATDPDLRTNVLNLVRSQAARDRDVARARAALGASSAPPAASALVGGGEAVRPTLQGSARLFLRRAYGKARRLAGV